MSWTIGGSMDERRAAHAERAGVVTSIETIVLDVTIQESIDHAVSEIMNKYGRIDVLINNAGFAVGGYVEDVPMEAWRSQLETNVFGVITTTRAVLPFMRAQKSGCIVNVSSIRGLSAFPGYAPYSTSKFAIEGFSEWLRLETKPFGVRVVLVEPGAYKTEIWRKGFEAIHTSDESPYASRLKCGLWTTRDPSFVTRWGAVRRWGYGRENFCHGNGINQGVK